MTAPPRFRHPAVALLVVALLYGTGCGLKETTPAPTVTIPPSGKSKDRAGAPEAAIKTESVPSLTAEQLAKEVKSEPGVAHAKYRGTVLELSGVVDGVGQAEGRPPYIKLNVPGDDFGIMCFLQDGEPWARVSPGAKVRVRGRWPEPPTGYTLDDCTLAEAGPNPAPVLSSEELAREYAANPEAANKKYRDRWLIVDGEVVEKNKEGGPGAYLKGSGKVRVKCTVSTFEKQLSQPLQPGRHVKLLGKYTRTASNTDTEVGLYDCLPITTSK